MSSNTSHRVSSPWKSFPLICRSYSLVITGSNSTAIFCNASSLPILDKGEQFPGVICIPAPLCSHYKIRLYCIFPLIIFQKYIILVATLSIDTSHLTRGGTTSTRHRRRASSRANGQGLQRPSAHGRHGSEAESAALRRALRPKGALAHLGAIQDALPVQHGPACGAVWPVSHVARRVGSAPALGPTRAGTLALCPVMARGIAHGSRLAAGPLALAHAAGDGLG